MNENDTELKCTCGSNQFKSGRVTIELRGIPCTITQDGPQYDDSEADHCGGWDFNNQNRVVCVDCGKEFEITSGDTGELSLRPADVVEK